MFIPPNMMIMVIVGCDPSLKRREPRFSSFPSRLKMGRGGFFVAPVVVETDAHPLIVACVGRNSVPLPAFK